MKKDLEYSQIAFYLGSIAHRIHNLMEFIESIKFRNNESPGTISLTNILIRLLQQFHNLILRTGKLYKEGKQPAEDTIRMIETISKYVSVIIPQIIEAIDGSRTDSPMYPFIQGIQRISNQVSYGQTIIYPTWVANFSFFDLRELIVNIADIIVSTNQETMGALLVGIPNNINVIKYPFQDENDVLRNCQITHEIGHFINKIYKYNELIYDEKGIQDGKILSKYYCSAPQKLDTYENQV